MRLSAAFRVLAVLKSNCTSSGAVSWPSPTAMDRRLQLVRAPSRVPLAPASSILSAWVDEFIDGLSNSVDKKIGSSRESAVSVAQRLPLRVTLQADHGGSPMVRLKVEPQIDRCGN
jgi:hypothetical protein